MLRQAWPMIFLPLIFWGITLPTPFYSQFWMFISLSLLILYTVFCLYIDVFTTRTRKRRMMGYSSYYGFLLSGIFLCGPALKLSSPIQQVIVIVVAILIILIIEKNNKFVYLSLNGDRAGNKLFLVVFYSIGILIVVAGGGGGYHSVVFLSNRLGETISMPYFSIILMLSGYWIIAYAQSLLFNVRQMKK